MTEFESHGPCFVGMVRVYLPRRTARDVDAIEKISRQVRERLGDAGCTSRFDIRFIELRDVAVACESVETWELPGEPKHWPYR